MPKSPPPHTQFRQLGGSAITRGVAAFAAVAAFLFAFFAPFAAPAVLAATNLDVSSGNIVIKSAGDYVITGATTSNTIKVNNGLTGVNITLNNVSVNVSATSGACAFDVTNATVNLTLQGTNTLQSGSGCAGIYMLTAATLTIGGTGTLNVSGGSKGAGIGTQSAWQICGTVIINSGTVNAQGGTYSAGIGGGYRGKGGTVIINGGTVNATGGNEAAGIGGGSADGVGTGGNVTINGGTVNATGGNGAAGIGGELSPGTLKITGGSVKRLGTPSFEATATNDSVNVYLSTLTVGYPPVANTPITAGVIGTVACSSTPNPTTGVYGIKDVATDADGKVYFWLPAASGGRGISLTAGGVLHSSAVVPANANDNNAATLYDHTPTPPGITTPSGALADGAGRTAYSTTLATSNYATRWTVTDGSLPDGLSLNTSTGEISGTPTVAGTFTFKVTATNDYGSSTETFTITINPPFSIEGGTYGSDYEWKHGDQGAPGLLTIKKNGTYTIGMLVSGSTMSTDVIAVEPGIVAVITLNNVSIDVSGKTNACPFSIGENANVTLILQGVSSLKSGILRPGLCVPENATLTISGSGGRLDVVGVTGIGTNVVGDACGKIIIDSGIVNASAKDAESPGIGCVGASGEVIINGGTVNATGGLWGAGIGGGPCDLIITINGGRVVATGASGGAGIGGGCWQSGDAPGATSGGIITINGGTVKATGGSGVITATGADRGASGIGGAAYGSSAPTVTITGGTVIAVGPRGPSIGNGCSYSTVEPLPPGTLTITGGSVYRSGGGYGTEATVTNGPDGTGSPVYLTTLTVTSIQMTGMRVVGNTPITAGTYTGGTFVDAIAPDVPDTAAGEYGIHDVATDADGKVYFWLPETPGDKEISLTAGGIVYDNAAVPNGSDVSAVLYSHNVPIIKTPVGALSGGSPDVPYSTTLNASAHPAATWSVTSGTLPAGLHLDPTTGTISGTPTAPGTFTFEVTATNSSGNSVPVEFSITIAKITPTTPPTGLTATDETANGANDGTISGVTDAMEYRIVTEPPSTYTPVPAGATTLTGLASGTYEVRYAETLDYKPSPAATVNIFAPTTVGDFTIKVVGTPGTGYTYASNTLTITADGTYVIGMASGVTTTTSGRIATTTGVKANITLDNVSIDLSAIREGGAFSMAGATVNLTLRGTNTLKSGQYRAGIYVPDDGAALTIDGTGTLNVYGGSFGAGIGGVRAPTTTNAFAVSSGAVTINSGTVNATGGTNGAGIGGGYEGVVGNVTITGGTVNATGGSGANDYEGGAGIGSGFRNNWSNPAGVVLITGGTVTAKGGNGAAGIGSGNTSCSVESVNIKGGTVTAIGSRDGAGIGSAGNYAFFRGANVSIDGGTVIAIGGSYSAGIGCRSTINNGGNPGTLKINGGSVQRSGGGGTEATATNGADVPVYLTTLTVGDPAVADKTPITAGTYTDGTFVDTIAPDAPDTAAGEYGIHDVKTDADGKVYFWLPAPSGGAQDRAISLKTPTGSTYSNAAVPAATDNTAAATLTDTPPTLDTTGGTNGANRTSDTAATVTFTPDETGTYYYTLVETGAPAPDADAIIAAGTAVATTGTTTTAGTGALAPDIPVTLTFANLTPVAHDLYLVARDPLGNTTTTPLKIEVPVYVPTDAELVADTAAALTWDTIAGSGNNPAAGGETTVTADLFLPTTDSVTGATITWTSGDPDIVDVSTGATGTGVVTRPAYGEPDAQVTLSATITVGTETQTKTFTLTILAKDTPPPHTHTFDTVWHADDTNHWHECTAGDGEKSDLAPHSTGDWVVDLAPTATATGTRHRECTVCAHTLATETIPATGTATGGNNGGDTGGNNNGGGGDPTGNGGGNGTGAGATPGIPTATPAAGVAEKSRLQQVFEAIRGVKAENAITVGANRTVTFNANATGGDASTGTGAALTYQWQKTTDGGATWENISAADGGTGAAFTTEVSAGERYRVTVTDTATGTETTHDAPVVNVLPAPEILAPDAAAAAGATGGVLGDSAQPTVEIATLPDGGVTLRVNARGDGQLYIQWFRYDTAAAAAASATAAAGTTAATAGAIFGAVQPEYTVTTAGYYRAKVTDRSGIIIASQLAKIAVTGDDSTTPPPPVATTYAFTISGGTITGSTAGADNAFAEGTRISITADPAPTGSHFVNWTSTAGGDIFDDPTAANTTFTMPANAVTITANYAPDTPAPPPPATTTTYALTIENGVIDDGSGSTDGDFAAGDEIHIAALAATSGYHFTNWTTSAGGTFANATAASTTFTMPANAVTITANYAPDTPTPPPPATTTYALTVEDGGVVGTDDTEFTAGSVVSISADVAPTGSYFVKWTSTAGDDIFDDPNAANTTFTMPASDTTITAKYALNTYALTVEGGGVVGTSKTAFGVGNVVTISADVAPAGYCFVEWTSSVGDDIFDDPTAANTTLTMPASAVTIKANYSIATTGTYLVIDLSGGPSAERYPFENLDNIPEGGWTDEYKTTKLVLRRIPAGTFIMGSPSYELGRGTDETQHEVTLTQDYYIGVFPVTQKQYELVNTIAADYGPIDDKQPMDYVRPSSINNFLTRLFQRTEVDFRLPTEAQWEYACRAGTTTALNSGVDLRSTTSDSAMDAVGRYLYNQSSVINYGNHSPADVGSYAPNAWGLYDFHGNVWEWCADWYGEYGTAAVVDPTGPDVGSYRVIRGGRFDSDAAACRSASRNKEYEGWYTTGLGFRVACVAASSKPSTPLPPVPVTTYALTVENGTGNGDSTGKFAAGATVSITADPAPSGYHFLYWTSTAGGTFAAVTDASTTFTMPANATTITANYIADIPPPTTTGTYVVIDLSGGPLATSYPVKNLADVPVGGWTDEYKTTKLVLRRIPAGTFLMGSPVEELGRYSNETQHEVTLTQDYYIGVFPVTQKQYELVVGSNPSSFKTGENYGKRPVEQVSWNDVTAAGTGFLALVSAKTGLVFGLPTEAQWEYACRAGTTTALNSGVNLTSITSDAAMASVGRYWYNGGSAYSYSDTTGNVGTAFVGTYEPNAWGLYDFHGNVYEWCADWYGSYGTAAVEDPEGRGSGSYRVLRGGSWYYYAPYCRSACRGWGDPSIRYDDVGFRVACVSASP